MDSVAPLKLPVIDFSTEDLKPGTSSWDLVEAEVLRALEEYGCFEALYNKVPLDLHNAMFGALEELFDRPLENKIQNTSDEPYYGYVGQTPLVHLYEGMGIDAAPALKRVQSFTNLMWPEGNASFCETVRSVTNRVSELDQLVKRMVFESFGIEKYYNSHIKATSYLLRVIKYKGPQTNETKVGVLPHTDKNFMTILHQSQVNGLEVQTKDGKYWINVTPSASSFIVMVGDAFMVWSNGRLHSCNHRVMMSGDDTRYSIALFSFGKDIVQVPEELVDDEHPLLFKPFDPMGLHRFYFTEEGAKAESTIKAYCGV